MAQPTGDSPSEEISRKKMSLIPFLLNDVLEDVVRPTIYDQHFGVGLPLTDFVHTFSVPLRSGYLRPWRNRSPQDSGLSNMINDKDSFKVNLDVQQFKPEELTVKVADKFLIVEGKHEERSDEHGFVSRQFTRRYRLPDNVDEKAITSSLSSDGVLQLCAPKVPAVESGARSIPITQSNQPAVKVKESENKMES